MIDYQLDQLFDLANLTNGSSNTNSTSVDGITNFFITSTTLSTVAMAASFVFFYTLAILSMVRRNLQPLKARSLYLVLNQLFSGFLIITLLGFKNIFERNQYAYPCFLSIFIIIFTPAIIFTPYLLRIIRLLMVFLLTRQTIQFRNSKISEKRFMIQKKILLFIISLKGLILINISILLITAVLYIAIMGAFRLHPFLTCNAMTSSVVVIAFTVILTVFYLVSIGVASLCMLPIRDNFGIMIGLISVCIPYIILSILTPIVVIVQKTTEKIEGNYLFMIAIWIDIAINVLIPIIRTYTWNRKNIEIEQGSDLETTIKNNMELFTASKKGSNLGITNKGSGNGLTDKESNSKLSNKGSGTGLSEKTSNKNNVMYYLELYCKKEFSTENLYCYIDIFIYKRNFSSNTEDENKQLLWKFYNDYLNPNNYKYDLNLSNDVRKIILSKFDTVNNTITDVSIDTLKSVEVATLSNLNDTWCRFIASDLYKKYKSNVATIDIALDVANLN
jgi:hypothetical protein